MTEQPVRKSKAVFVFLTLAVIGAILVTVLFANDRRHLNALLLHYGLMEPPPPVEPPQKRKRAEPSLPPLPGTEILLSGRGVTPFARVIRFPAPDMCELFARRGFAGEGWKASPVSDIAECTAEKLFDSGAGKDGPAGSLFAMVRGTAKDDISSLRLKLVTPDGAEGIAARQELDDTLGALIEATGWSDLEPLRERIRHLEEIDMTNYSLSVTFKREFTNRDAYNLIIRPTSTNPDVRKLQKPAQPGAFNQ